MGDNRTCGCRGIPQQVCDECQGVPVHLHDYDPSCVESRVGECVLDRVEAKVGNLDSGRHPKWQRVEPGTVIPAGQPYAVKPHTSATQLTWMEYGEGSPREQRSDERYEWFVDSSWRPPLELPTKPTWGILIHDWPEYASPRFGLADMGKTGGWFGGVPIGKILDFIPLTNEQVARIEAAR